MTRLDSKNLYVIAPKCGGVTRFQKNARRSIFSLRISGNGSQKLGSTSLFIVSLDAVQNMINDHIPDSEQTLSCRWVFWTNMTSYLVMSERWFGKNRTENKIGSSRPLVRSRGARRRQRGSRQQPARTRHHGSRRPTFWKKAPWSRRRRVVIRWTIYYCELFLIDWRTNRTSLARTCRRHRDVDKDQSE